MGETERLAQSSQDAIDAVTKLIDERNQALTVCRDYVRSLNSYQSILQHALKVCDQNLGIGDVPWSPVVAQIRTILRGHQL